MRHERNDNARARRQRGMMGPAAAILAALVAGLAISSMSASTRTLRMADMEMQSERARLAARAGLEFALMGLSRSGECGVSVFPRAGDGTPGQPLQGFEDMSVRTVCSRSTTTEGGETREVFDISALACSASSCPASVPGPRYAERKLTAQFFR